MSDSLHDIRIVKVSRRSCFYADEKLAWTFTLMNFTPANRKNCTLAFSLNGGAAEKRTLEKVGTHTGKITWECTASTLRTGEHRLTVQLREQDATLLEKDFTLAIVAPPDRDRMATWHWPSTVHYDALEAGVDTALHELDLIGKLGFNLANFRAGWAILHPDRAVFLIEEAMKRGISLGILVENSDSGIFRADPGTPDSARLVAPDGQVTTLVDPFSPFMRKKAERLIDHLMTLFAEFPSMNAIFMNSEVEDRLKLSCTPAARRRHEKALGFPLDRLRALDRSFLSGTAEPPELQPGVIPDDDPDYAFARYYFEHGDGWAHVNRIMARACHRVRPDLLTIADPFRLAPVPKRFAGMNTISSWTYTNPDPKSTLFVETLSAAARRLGNLPLPSITLWNYAGSLVPSGADRFAREQTLRMGPDRWTECAWINLARGVAGIGNYFGSPLEFYLSSGEGGDPVIYSPATEQAIADFHRDIAARFGALARLTDNVPRQAAILDCYASRLYGNAPRSHAHYTNYQIYNFYAVMNMAWIHADVLFEEDLLEDQLHNYRLLALPSCPVLTESVYRKIKAFAEKGGIVIADQCLKADIPNAILFDFDFSFRRRVNANSMANGCDYSIKDDDNSRHIVDKSQLKGLPAHRDQEIMETYAAGLRERLDKQVPRACDCSSPKILGNLRRSGDFTYLFAVNDARTYDERSAQYQAILEKGVPATGTFTVTGNWQKPVFRNLVTGRPIAARQLTSDTWTFDLTLPAAGGAIVAIAEQHIGKTCTVNADINPAAVTAQVAAPKCNGVRPVQFTWNGQHTTRILRNGAGTFSLPLAATEDTPDSITLTDLLFQNQP